MYNVIDEINEQLHDEDHLNYYQNCAREGGQIYQEYLNKFVYDCESFDNYLEKIGGNSKLKELRNSMLSLL